MRRTLVALLIATSSAAGAQAADTVVRNAAAPVHAGTPTLVSDFKIGSADGPAELQFTVIQEVLVAADGKIWMVHSEERGNPEVRLFDATGKFLKRVGGRGAGPGEYQSICGIAQLPDGRVLVRDVQQTRINVYRADGSTDTTWQFRTRYGWLQNGVGGVRVDANGIAWLPFFVYSGEARSDMYLRLRSDGTILDTVARPDVPAPPVSRGVEVRGSTGGLSRLGNDPYSPRAFWSWSPLGYFVTGVSTRYAFELRAPQSGQRDWRAGDPVVSVRRPSAAPIAVGKAERDNHLAIYKYRLDRSVASGGTVEHGLPEISETKPPFDGLRVAPDARIWVSVAMPSEPYEPPGWMDRPDLTREPPLKWRAPVVYDVFESTGTYVGRIPLARDTYPVFVSGDVLWIVSRDDDGSSFLTKTRVVWK